MVEKLHTPLPLHSASEAKDQHYQTVCTDIKNVLQGEAMTQACHALTSICTCAVHLHLCTAPRLGGGWSVRTEQHTWLRVLSLLYR